MYIELNFGLVTWRPVQSPAQCQLGLTPAPDDEWMDLQFRFLRNVYLETPPNLPHQMNTVSALRL